MSKNDHILLENQHFVAILSIYFRCPWFSIRFILVNHLNVWNIFLISFLWSSQCHQKLGIISFLYFSNNYLAQLIRVTNFTKHEFRFFFRKKGVCLFILMYYMFQQLNTEKRLSKVLESFLIRIKLLLNELSEINLEKNVPLNHIIKKIYQIWSALADL